MSESKPKLMLRPGVNISEKSPSPSTKLMLNHGKPNFTIDRSKPKASVHSPQTPPTPEASQVVLKSTTFNGVIKPSSLKITQKNILNNRNGNGNDSENEVNRVVLRRTKLPDVNDRAAGVPDDEPEFIKAQRRIAERLAKEGNLDFENRKSGYFTHVMMSPTTPTKNAEVPLIESAKIQRATVVEAVDKPEPVPVVEEEKVEEVKVEEVKENGGQIEVTEVEATTQNGSEASEVPETNGVEAVDQQTEVIEAAKALVEEVIQSVPEQVPHVQSTENGLENGHAEQNNTQNGEQNGLQNDTPTDSQTESHNGSQNGDVNFEPKTVVSFSKELSNEPNKYPDTVKVSTDIDASATKDSELLQEMSKLKFDITADSEDIKVTPVLQATTIAE